MGHGPGHLTVDWSNGHQPRRPLLPLTGLKVVVVVTGTLLSALLAAGAVRPAADPTLEPASPATAAAILRAIAILALLGEAALLALLLFVRTPRSGGTLKSRRSPFLTILVWAVQLLAALLAYQLYRQSLRRAIEGTGIGLPARAIIPRPTTSLAQGQEWLTVLIVVLVLLSVAVLVFRRLRGRRLTFSADRMSTPIRNAIDAGLAALEAESDPRRAVIAAYAGMESSLAGAGLPRKPPEASLEYLERLLPELGTESVAARRLTELFQLAKYSHHEIDVGMRTEALRSLWAIRADLARWAPADVH